MATSRRSKDSDEDYWSSSSAAKIKTRVNLFDDGLDLQTAKDLMRQQNPFSEEDEENDYINCESTPKVEIGANSARFRPSTAGTPTSHRPSAQDTRSSQPPSVQRPTFQANAFATDLSIDDVVSQSGPKKLAPTASDMAKLEAEINFLKRSLHAAKTERFDAQPPKETVKRMIMGQTYSLELYRSKVQKIELLDAAVKSHDGNAITASILFLRDTIKPSVFNLELMRRPEAVEHYINFLRKHREQDKLVDLLGMLGRTDEAAMIKYKQAVSSKSADTKIRNLQACHRAHFHTDSWLAHESALLCEQVALLERQRPIEEEDLREVTKGNPKFRTFPRASTIVDMPVMTTLFYCSFYHYDLLENYLASPAAIKKAHSLTDRQYVWGCILARAKLKQWKDLEPLFQTKGFFGGIKMKAIVPFDRVVQALNKMDAPRNVLNDFCKHIDDSHRKLQIAEKYNCHETVMETFKDQKDRQAITDYQARLKINSQEWFYACDILRNSNIKWKN